MALEISYWSSCQNVYIKRIKSLEILCDKSLTSFVVCVTVFQFSARSKQQVESSACHLLQADFMLGSFTDPED
jgi:hypothetical protein